MWKVVWILAWWYYQFTPQFCSGKVTSNFNFIIEKERKKRERDRKREKEGERERKREKEGERERERDKKIERENERENYAHARKCSNNNIILSICV